MVLPSIRELASLISPLRFKVIEPREGYWTGQKTWGGDVSTVYPDRAGVAFTVANSDNFPGPPKVHTIQLFRGDDRSVLNADMRARVSYGVGGSNNEFLVDWAAGVQFAVIANSVRVDAVSYAPNLLPYNGTNGLVQAPLLLGAAFGSGSVGHGPPVTLSESLVEIAPGALRDFDVPDFARAFTVRLIDVTHGPPNTVGNYDPSFRTYCGFQALSGPLIDGDCQIFAGPAGVHGLPIPAGTRRISIYNQTNVAPAPMLNVTYRVLLQWVLSL